MRWCPRTADRGLGAWIHRKVPPAPVPRLRRCLAPLRQVTWRLIAVTNRDRTDGVELRRYVERLPEGIDSLGRNAEETSTQSGIYSAQQHQQCREPRIDIPVGGGPPRIRPIGEALICQGITIEICVLVGVRDDQHRSIDGGGQPLLGAVQWAHRVAETGNVGMGVENQKTPPLSEAR